MIWFDATIVANESNKDCIHIIIKFRDLVNKVYTFTHADECIDFLTCISKKSKQERTLDISDNSTNFYIVLLSRKDPNRNHSA